MKFRSVACGELHTLAVSMEGDVFCWGDNSKKQLGLGYTSKDFIWTVEQNLHFPGVVLQLATGTSGAAAVITQC